MDRSFIDQLGREVIIDHPPERIISTVPSQTELLFYLGLNDRVVGITKFCIHPKEKFKSTPKIGGTKKLDLKKIEAINPGLIIANKEENEQEQIKALAAKYPVWISDIKKLEDSLEMITTVGDMTGKVEEAQSLAGEIKTKFSNISQLRQPLKAAYFIWQNPYMGAGNDTFVNDILNKC